MIRAVTDELVENHVSYAIRGCVFKVYNKLGPGLFESAYEAALAYELREAGCKVDCQVPISMEYESTDLGIAFRMDLLVEDLVIVEVKSVEHIQEVHHKQLLTYLKLTGLKLGILVNFNTDDIEKSIIRKVNKLD